MVTHCAGTGADLPSDGPQPPSQRLSNGDWLVAGEGALIRVGTGGTTATIRMPVPNARLEITDGDIDDIAIAIAATDAGPPVLHAMVGTHWLKGLPADGIATISSVSRMNDEEWLVAGRTVEDKGFAAIYAPLSWELRNAENVRRAPPSPALRNAIASSRSCRYRWPSRHPQRWSGLRITNSQGAQLLGRRHRHHGARLGRRGRPTLVDRGETMGVSRATTTARPCVRFAEGGLVVLMTVEGRIVAGRME